MNFENLIAQWHEAYASTRTGSKVRVAVFPSYKPVRVTSADAEHFPGEACEDSA